MGCIKMPDSAIHKDESNAVYNKISADFAAVIERWLERALTPRSPRVSGALYQAAGYSVFAGGKRLRPILLLAASRAAGGDIQNALPFACALELIHAYSLIHDDLPAMDDGELRRGKPSNHIVYGEAMAILAGDMLLNLAYETMSEAVLGGGHREARAMSLIARAAGAEGMVGGQALDISAGGGPDLPAAADELRLMHALKTGALITAALTAGAVIGGAGDETCKKFERAGELFGQAYQIKDDILDAEGDVKALGKPVMSDDRARRVTYVSVFGLQKAGQIYSEAAENAMVAVRDIGDAFLTAYISGLIDRVN